MITAYMLKSAICMLAFYLVYKLLLGHTTLHSFNRVLILLMVGLSVVLPFISISTQQPMPVTESMQVLQELLVMPSGTMETISDTQYNIYHDLFYVGNIGWFLVFFWFAYGDARVWSLLNKWESFDRGNGVKIHLVGRDNTPPFSYFRHIVMSESDYNSNCGQAILEHEQAHVRLLHSWDVLLMNLIILLQWWNPAAWLLRRELKQVHEYEADEAVLERGVDAQQYQLLLIRKSVGDQLFSMANNLNYQSLKKRIRMMTTKRSSRWQQLRALTMVPVAALAVVAFASPEVENVAAEVEQAVRTVPLSLVEEETPAETVKGKAQQVIAGKAMKKQELLVNSHPVIRQPEQEADTTKIYEMVEQMPQFPGGDKALMEFLYSNIKYPKDAMEAQKQGRVVITFVVDRDGSVAEARVVKSVFPSLDEEALRMVNAMPKWNPGMHKGKAVRVKYTIPVSFRLQGEKEKAIYAIENAGSFQREPLILIDGKEATKANLEALDPQKIEAVDVLRGVSGEQHYGEKGKNGVVIVKLKKQ